MKDAWLVRWEDMSGHKHEQIVFDPEEVEAMVKALRMRYVLVQTEQVYWAAYG